MNFFSSYWGFRDSPDVQETLKPHAEATGRSLEEVLADSDSGILLGRLSTLAEVANVATMMASERARAMTGVIANATLGYIFDWRWRVTPSGSSHDPGRPIGERR